MKLKFLIETSLNGDGRRTVVSTQIELDVLK